MPPRKMPLGSPSRVVVRNHLMSTTNPTLFQSITNGDIVTIITRHGSQLKGRAVMRGPAGWVLNLGGRHGTPGIADDNNVIKVTKKR